MGLIRKPKKKRHRTVKDPISISLRKAGSKQVRKNRRCGPDMQEMSRADRAVMEFIKAAKENPSGSGNRRRKKKPKLELLDSTRIVEAVEPYQYGMNKPLKPVPVYRQHPGESDREFMSRVDKSTWHVLDQSRFEDKYEVDVWQDPDTGQVDLKSRKPTKYANDVEAELAEMKQIADADPKIKKHVKFGAAVRVADPMKKAEEDAAKKKQQEGPGATGKRPKKATKGEASARKAVKVRNRCKLLKARKKLKRLGESGEEWIDAGAPVKDDVAFGEVVSAPPLLQHKPRKADGFKTNRPGRKDLLLKSILEKSDEARSRTPKKKKKPENFAASVHRREIEEERQRVMAAYKEKKRLKLASPD